MNFNDVVWPEIWQATLDTLVMSGISLLFTVLLGLPLGVLLFVSGKRQLLQHTPFNAALSVVVNFFRSVPFIILLIIMIPVTVLLIGTSIGVAGAIPPLVFAAAPFYAWVRRAASWEPNWNFNKVLIGRDGRIAGTFGSGDEPHGAKLSAAITAALATPATDINRPEE